MKHYAMSSARQQIPARAKDTNRYQLLPTNTSEHQKIPADTSRYPQALADIKKQNKQMQTKKYMAPADTNRYNSYQQITTCTRRCK